MKYWVLLLIIIVACLGSTALAGTFVYGVEYFAKVTENKVVVCIGSFPREAELASCPNRKDLFRQHVASGEVVVLSSPTCEKHETHGTYCYVDECVPPGTYRYGLGIQFPCPVDIPRRNYVIDYYVEVQVTQILPLQCMRSKGSLPPEKTHFPTPWKDNPTQCKHLSLCGCNATTTPHTSTFPWLPVFLTLLLFFITIRKRP